MPDGFLTPTEQSELQQLLLRILDVRTNKLTRRSLVNMVPDVVRDQIHFSDAAKTDIEQIIEQTNRPGSRLKDGTWPILLVLEQAISMTEEFLIQQELVALRDKVLPRARPVAPRGDGQGMERQAYKLSLLHHFDLQLMLEEFRDGIRYKTGLVGFDVCSGVDALAMSFCERLEEDFRYRRLRRWDGIENLDSLNSPPEDVVANIAYFKTHHGRQAESFLLYPVRLNLAGDRDEAELLASEFWRLLHDQCHDGVNGLLTVLMFTPIDIPCLAGVIRLNKPVFREVDCEKWIEQVVKKRQQWLSNAPEIVDTWLHKMVAASQTGNGLNIAKVYRHMRSAIQSLQDNWNNCEYSYVEFLNSLP